MICIVNLIIVFNTRETLAFNVVRISPSKYLVFSGLQKLKIFGTCFFVQLKKSLHIRLCTSKCRSCTRIRYRVLRHGSTIAPCSFNSFNSSSKITSEKINRSQRHYYLRRKRERRAKSKQNVTQIQIT